MSGTYPFYPVFETVNFKINTPTLTSETLSGKRRRVGMGHSYYTFSAKYLNVGPYNIGPVTGFLASQYGGLESFQIVVPVVSFSKSPNPPSTTPATSAALPIGNNSIALTNCGNTKTVLAAGDYFKFANHTKVYMCITDCISNSSGAATLYFSGSAVSAVPSGTDLTITQVPFTVCLDGDVQEYAVGNGGTTNMSVDFREVW